MNPEQKQPVSARDALTIKRILRVNHAGEFAAIRIYSAQIVVSKRLYPDILPALADMLADEQRHCAAFSMAMPARLSSPCRVMSLWSLGGSLLGFLTAIVGRQAIWICTAAVETTVHRHLDDQLHFLAARDPELTNIILSIRDEELAHLHHAEDQINSQSLGQRLLDRTICVATEVVIWLSTWGDSTRMARDLRTFK
jgi:ubiquinone biosynthesis monooxygenase Coq7